MRINAASAVSTHNTHCNANAIMSARSPSDEVWLKLELDGSQSHPGANAVCK